MAAQGGGRKQKRGRFKRDIFNPLPQPRNAAPLKKKAFFCKENRAAARKERELEIRQVKGKVLNSPTSTGAQRQTFCRQLFFPRRYRIHANDEVFRRHIRLKMSPPAGPNLHNSSLGGGRGIRGGGEGV